MVKYCSHCNKEIKLFEFRYKLEDKNLLCYQCHINYEDNKRKQELLNLKHELKNSGAWTKIAEFAKKHREDIRELADVDAETIALGCQLEGEFASELNTLFGILEQDYNIDFDLLTLTELLSLTM